MFKHISKFLIVAAMLVSGNAFAVLPNIFATQPSGNVAASLLDQNYTFLESQGVQALTTTGSSNAYVATPADAWVTGYSQYVGRALTVVPNFTNTAAATVNVSGLGAVAIYKNVTGTPTALISGDMTSGIPAILICDGTGFLLANPTVAASSSGSMVLLNTQTITSAASVSVTSGITSAYSHYVWEISNLVSSNNLADGYITVQQGGSFIGGSGYEFTGGILNGSASGAGTGDQAFFNVTGGQSSISSTSTNPSVIRFEFWNPAVASRLIAMSTTIGGSTSVGNIILMGGTLKTIAATTGVKLIMSSGNIATATAKLYGVQ
jgi:hypothetical protein